LTIPQKFENITLWERVKYFQPRKSKFVFFDSDEDNYFFNNPKCDNLKLTSPTILQFYSFILILGEDTIDINPDFVLTKIYWNTMYFWVK